MALPLELILGGLGGAVIGAAIMYLLVSGSAARRSEGLRSDLDQVRQTLAETTTSLRVTETARDNLQARVDERLSALQTARDTEVALREHMAGLERQLAETSTTLSKEREAHDEKVRELNDIRAQIEERMKNMANDLLQQNTEGFLKRASEYFETQNKAGKSTMEQLVKPIGETLKTYQDKLAEMEKERKRDEGAIHQELKQLAHTHVRLQDTTSNLVNALRSAPKTRGRWGEQQLKTVLEMAGMTENVDFVTEHSVDGESGKLRPDAVLRLPGDRQIVVDAKTPMANYLDAVEATDDDERNRHLALHASHMRRHAEQLGSKQYWEAIGNTPDFVVMFVPGENLYAAAIERDPDLFEFAYDRQVVIATPTTFLALAKAIAFGWRQERASQNAQLVLNEGAELYKRLQGLGGKVMKLSKALDRTVSAHNEFVGSLETRVMPQGRKLHDLGVGTRAGELDSLEQVEKTPRAPLPGKDLELEEPDTEHEPVASGDVASLPMTGTDGGTR